MGEPNHSSENEAFSVAISGVGGEQNIPAGNGILVFRIMPKIGFPPEIPIPVGYEYKENESPLDNTIAGGKGTYLLENETGKTNRQVYGRPEKPTFAPSMLYPTGYPIYKYYNATFRIDRTVEVNDVWDYRYCGEDMFTKWNSQLTRPEPQGDVDIPVSCGDKIKITVTNAGTTDVDNTFIITDY